MPFGDFAQTWESDRFMGLIGILSIAWLCWGGGAGGAGGGGGVCFLSKLNPIQLVPAQWGLPLSHPLPMMFSVLLFCLTPRKGDISPPKF